MIARSTARDSTRIGQARLIYCRTRVVIRYFAEPSRLIFLGTLALVIIIHHAFYFATPWHENGDFALNALQVERAKHLNEIYGNYSRFHFNHPGPAFFYVYAAGEYLLHDWLQVVPSPHNAHALAGLALQMFFFTSALVLAADWIRARWFLPLALAAAGVHFGLTQSAFTSVWPPHVLLMPFLCFVVAGASVAAGHTRHLLLTVLAGSFLVHGHVAQPLMVVTLFVAAYALIWWRTQRLERRTPWSGQGVAHGLAIGCIALFLAPLAVDLSLGRESNLAQIWQFMQAPKDARTYADAFAYLLTFFGYAHEAERYLPEMGVPDFSFLRERLGFYVGWMAMAAFVGWRWWRIRHDAPNAPATRFLSALIVLFVVGLITALLWARLQTGPMFAFNAHFLHGLNYVLLLAAAALLARELPDRGARVGGAVLLGVGALALWKTTAPVESTLGAEHSWMRATADALRADPEPDKTKLLLFTHDDWGDAARTALALKRLGASYRVDGNWRFMFGRYRAVDPTKLEDKLDHFAVWRLSRHVLQGRSAPLEGGLRVYFDVPQLFPASHVIDCRRGGNLEHFALSGFTTPDENGSWTNLSQAALQFRSPTVMEDVRLRITAEPFAAELLGAQPMNLIVNGIQVGTVELTEPRTSQTVELLIPPSVWNLRSTVIIVFEFPAAASPRALRLSTDPRMLGWAISRIVFGSE
jgi:hypothetical protein